MNATVSNGASDELKIAMTDEREWIVAHWKGQVLSPLARRILARNPEWTSANVADAMSLNVYDPDHKDLRPPSVLAEDEIREALVAVAGYVISEAPPAVESQWPDPISLDIPVLPEIPRCVFPSWA